jgi:hypothetical protein
MDFGSSVARYFSEALVDRLKTQTIRTCLRGEFFVDREKLIGKWSESEDGRFRLWCPLGIGGYPPSGEYIVASDLSGGIGGPMSSNSTITVFDRRAGKKVLSFASPSVLPYDMAEIAIAVCRWFPNWEGRPAFLIWEDNNHGMEFRVRVERSDFNFYYRRRVRNKHLYSRETDTGGYYTTKRSALLGPYREALLEGFFNNPDAEAVEELRQYERDLDGEPVHVSQKTRDSSGARGAHGDRVLADALAWHASLTFGDQQAKRADGGRLNVNNVRTHLVPENSAAWRRARYLEMMQREKIRSNW